MQEIESAIEQAMVEAGLSPDAQSLNFQAFLRMLNADMSTDTTRKIQKFESMRTSTIRADGSSASLSGLLRDTMRDACTSCSIRRRTGTSGPLAEDVWEQLVTNRSGGRSSGEYPDKPSSVANILLTAAAQQGSGDPSGPLGTVREDREGVIASVSSSSKVFVPETDSANGGSGSGNGGHNGGAYVGGGYWDDGHRNDEENSTREYASKVGKGQKLEGMFSEGSLGGKKQSSVDAMAELALT